MHRVDRQLAVRVIWARKPFQGRHGMYVAVRLRDGKVAIAIRHSGHLEWVPAERALTEREAEAWARNSF